MCSLLFFKNLSTAKTIINHSTLSLCLAPPLPAMNVGDSISKNIEKKNIIDI